MTQAIKLDTRTLQVLKNFATINSSILFRPGSKLATISPGKTIMASAKVAQTFESEFAIYDLSRFLSVLSLFSDPELQINEKFVTIQSGSKRLDYTFASPGAIVAPNAKDKALPDADVSFKLSADQLADVVKATSVLRLPELVVSGDGTTIRVQALDTKNPTSDKYSIDVGETTAEFRAVFRIENIKLMPDDYLVEVYKIGVAKFYGTDTEYFVAVEAHSTF